MMEDNYQTQKIEDKYSKMRSPQKVIYKESNPNTTGKLNVIDKFIRNFKNEN